VRPTQTPGTSERQPPGEPLTHFGPYVLYEVLGVGASATVYRAELRGVAGFRRLVALKQLHPHIAKVPEMVALFAHEARLGSCLRHPNVAQTFDFGSVGDVHYITMAYVPGPTLAQVARQCAQARSPMPLSIVLGILTQLCDALDHVHNARDLRGNALGVVHRDVSPSNVILSTDFVVKLIDLGVAKAESSRIHTQPGMLKGKLGYLAPEYLRGQLDARADLFGLGVIAYELLSNRRLFVGRNEFDTLTRLREMPIPPLSSGSLRVPRALEDVVMTALRRDPDQRWQTASAMRAALSEFERALPAQAGAAQTCEWLAWLFSRSADPRGDAGARKVGDIASRARTVLVVSQAPASDAAARDGDPASPEECSGQEPTARHGEPVAVVPDPRVEHGAPSEPHPVSAASPAPEPARVAEPPATLFPDELTTVVVEASTSKLAATRIFRRRIRRWGPSPMTTRFARLSPAVAGFLAARAVPTRSSHSAITKRLPLPPPEDDPYEPPELELQRAVTRRRFARTLPRATQPRSGRPRTVPGRQAPGASALAPAALAHAARPTPVPAAAPGPNAAVSAVTPVPDTPARSVRPGPAAAARVSETRPVTVRIEPFGHLPTARTVELATARSAPWSWLVVLLVVVALAALLLS